VSDSDRLARSTLESLRHRAEPLWIGALGVHFIVVGRVLVPALIHLLGRGGQVETVEWAIYMSLLVGYAPLVWIIARVLPRLTSRRVASWLRLAIVCAALVELGFYALFANWIFILSATMAAVLTVVALGYTGQSEGQKGRYRGLPRVLPLLFAAAFGWMCAGGLVSWSDALEWISGSPRTALTVIAATALSAFALRGAPDLSPREQRLRWPDFLALAILVVFSFRTFPMVEFYHWGFYVGPIEQLRQGGRLLWDTPSQYGFLSILIPAALPASAWVSFWFYQSAIFAIVAALMYVTFRRLGSRWTGALFAFAVTFTTLFFRPRDETLILPAQMTPSGGPVRFLWSFLLLAFIAGHYFRPAEKQRSRDFVFGGTAIWLASVLWSAEGAIYCSAIWFCSFAVLLAQRAVEWRDTGVPARNILRRAAQWIAVPLVALAVTVVLVLLGYLLLFHMSPDWRGYVEYVVLYSRGGFGALPVDPSGSVWYLMLLFLIISTMAAMYLTRDARNPRLVALAGLWGGAWSVGSYFVGRSHPVNALSLVPLLLYSTAIGLSLLSTDRSRHWHRLVVTALVPAFAMPIALTLGHAGFAAEVTQRQLQLSRFTEQVPTMEPALHSLLVQSGARPSDSFVRVGDGRLMLPAWSMAPPTRRIVSDRSWLPKPYEIIGSLPADRRQAYIDRNAKSIPVSGWLIHSKRHTIPGYSALLAQIERTRHEERRYENADWILSWMAIGPRGSATAPTAPRTGRRPTRRNSRSDSSASHTTAMLLQK
jgi:hypothetical protein